MPQNTSTSKKKKKMVPSKSLMYLVHQNKHRQDRNIFSH